MEGPRQPPSVHPDWQGSISSKWMDSGSGLVRGLGRGKPNALREGMDGPARQGLGGFAMDSYKRVQEECGVGKLKGCASVPSFPPSCPPWADRPEAMVWKPCRRKLGHLQHPEPDKLTKRPPFVRRRGDVVVTHEARSHPEYDLEASRFKDKVAKDLFSRRKREELRADRMERDMVHKLEAWEREHLAGRRAVNGVQSTPNLHSGLGDQGASLGVTLGSAQLGRAVPQRLSNAGLEFCRRQVA